MNESCKRLRKGKGIESLEKQSAREEGRRNILETKMRRAKMVWATTSYQSQQQR
jgi:hypothetical protein